MNKPSFDKLTVLVADPAPHMATLINQMLRHLKVKSVAEAHTSSAAQQLLNSRKFGVLMLDDSLGPMDGVALTRALRAADGGLNRDTPVIMMSAVPEASRIAAARDAGITEFLRKPFAASHIETRLVSILAAPRPFIETKVYAGPDRRRKRAEFKGGERRAATE